MMTDLHGTDLEGKTLKFRQYRCRAKRECISLHNSPSVCTSERRRAQDNKFKERHRKKKVEGEGRSRRTKDLRSFPKEEGAKSTEVCTTQIKITFGSRKMEQYKCIKIFVLLKDPHRVTRAWSLMKSYHL